MRILFCALLTLLPLGVLRAEPEEKPKPWTKPEAFRAQALQFEKEGRIDEAIETYGRMFSRYDGTNDIVEQARDLELWMRLLWKRDKPAADNESMSDRQQALKAGKNFIETTGKQAQAELADEKLEVWKRIETLVMEFEMELDWEKKLSWYLGVYEKSGNAEDREDALYSMIKLLLEHKEYKRAEERCREFLKKGNAFSKVRKAKVMLWLGNCQERRGQLDDAISSYVRTWSTHMGVIEASAPAMEAWMRILWERNKPGDEFTMSDRDGATQAGRHFVDLTGRFEDKMREVDHRLWLRVKDLTEQYEAELKKAQ